jgi:hypothetical protein
MVKTTYDEIHFQISVKNMDIENFSHNAGPLVTFMHGFNSNIELPCSLKVLIRQSFGQELLEYGSGRYQLVYGTRIV